MIVFKQSFFLFFKCVAAEWLVFLVVWAYPHGSVQLLQHAGMKKYGVGVVGLKAHHGHLHLVRLEQDVKHEVHQEIELLVMQTARGAQRQKLRVILSLNTYFFMKWN